MNGSYSVPIGSSRSPLIECDSPSADNRMNRFISAMPSSMCWPLGENSQLKVEGMRSLLKVSAMLSRANRPRRLTHGPRLVETVTSGEVVTMRSASAVIAARQLVEQRAEAELRRHLRLDRHRELVGHRNARRLQAARAAARERHLVEEGLHLLRARRAGPRTGPIRGPGECSSAARKALHLRRRHQAGVIVLVAGDRQAEALHRVADEAGRPVVIDAAEGLERSTADRGRRDCSSAAPARRRSAARSAASPRPGRRSRRGGACATPRRPGTPAPSRAGSGSGRSTAASVSPPGSRNAACCSEPYFRITTSQPKFLNSCS